FQAEDGIRDPLVTGVQTCALPISPGGEDRERGRRGRSRGGSTGRRRSSQRRARGRRTPRRSPATLVRWGVGLAAAGDVVAVGAQIGRASCREGEEGWEVGGEV